MPRAIVRGMDEAWIRSIYSVALVPDAVIYLRIGVDELIPRVIFSRGFDYWESGMDRRRAPSRALGKPSFYPTVPLQG